MKDYRVRIWGITKADRLDIAINRLLVHFGSLCTAENIEVDMAEMKDENFFIDIRPVEIEHRGEKVPHGWIPRSKDEANPHDYTGPDLFTTYTDALRNYGQRMYSQLEYLEAERLRLEDRVKELEDKCGRLTIENRNLQLLLDVREERKHAY